MILARELLKELRDRNIPACVAGGYVRDMILGRKPKDMDVVVFGDHVNRRIIDWHDAATILTDVTHEVQEGILIITDERGIASYPVDIIQHLFKGKYKGMDVDLIFYKEVYFNATAVIDSFDMSINQGYITEKEFKAPDVTTLKLNNLARCTEARVVKGYNMIMDNYCKNHNILIPGATNMHPTPKGVTPCMK